MGVGDASLAKCPQRIQQENDSGFGLDMARAGMKNVC